MVKIVQLTFFLLLSSFGIAQNIETINIYGLFYKHQCKTTVAYQELKKHQTAYSIADQVIVRSDSSLNGNVLEKLALAEAVEVLDWTVSYQYEVNGHGDRWVKVKTQKGITGFVYGVLLAKVFLKYDFNKNGASDLILLGSDYQSSSNAVLKVVENGRLIANMQVADVYVDANSETFAMLRIIDDPGLQGSLILEAAAGSNFCATIWQSAFYYWQYDMKEIFNVLIRHNKSDSFDFIIFPSDHNGQKNQIIIHECVLENIGTNEEFICRNKSIYSLVNGQF